MKFWRNIFRGIQSSFLMTNFCHRFPNFQNKFWTPDSGAPFWSIENSRLEQFKIAPGTLRRLFSFPTILSLYKCYVMSSSYDEIKKTIQFLWNACTLSCIISILCNWVTFSNISAVSSSFDSLIEFDCVLKLPVLELLGQFHVFHSRQHYTNLSMIKAFPRHLMAFLTKFQPKILQSIFL